MIISFLGDEFLQDEGTIAFLKKTGDDRNFAEVKKYVNNLEDIESIQAMIKWRIEAKDRNNSHKTDDYLLQLILNQTERVGKMLKRFSPIVSSESKTDKFNVFNKINGVFLDLSSRLNICNIKYNLQGDREAEMCGDSVQFEQVFYNLILNSMQAISESMDRGCITVKISVNHQGNLLIFFIDNGPGIAAEHIKKVFEPFYSTKSPTSGNGGEGLGLFVVWNILKIFNGSIRLDKEYKKGAKFIITIKPKEVNLE